MCTTLNVKDKPPRQCIIYRHLDEKRGMAFSIGLDRFNSQL